MSKKLKAGVSSRRACAQKCRLTLAEELELSKTIERADRCVLEALASVSGRSKVPPWVNCEPKPKQMIWIVLLAS